MTENLAETIEHVRARADLDLGRALVDGLSDRTRPIDERRALGEALTRINGLREHEGRPPISDPAALAAEAAERLDERSRLLGVGGGSWLADVPTEIPALWGDGERVAWAEAEALMLYGSDGAGKGVLAQNLVLRLIGVIPGDFLGLPVASRRRVVYLAQDRPAQIRRSLRRMVGEVDLQDLDDRLAVVWEPLPKLIDEDPDQLVRIAETNEADVIVVDSVKDIIAKPSDEESGLAMRRAYARALAAGVDVLLLHHDRKAHGQTKRTRLGIDDVYGSRFMVGGCGSVLAINGGSGDPVVDLRHIKQPAGEVGPFRVLYDFETGGATIHHGTDLLSLVRASSRGLTARDAAAAVYDSDKPTPAEKERARRSLEALVAKGLAVGRRSGDAGAAVTYYATDDRLDGIQ